jgi:hypothetical protein
MNDAQIMLFMPSHTRNAPIIYKYRRGMFWFQSGEQLRQQGTVVPSVIISDNYKLS